MPSDDRRSVALQAMQRERDAFRTAVTGALEQVRALVATASPEPAFAHAGSQLGSFGAERLDTARFAELFAPTHVITPTAAAPLRYVQILLQATLSANDEAFFLVVPPGGDLRNEVLRALAMLGRVFAAAHALADLRNGIAHAETAEPLLAPLSPERWTRGERLIAPPLVVEVNGADLRVGGLEEVLQGTQKIVLLVEGPCPPASLVRLITSGVCVVQCRGVEQLKQFTSYGGPGIAAIMSEGAEFSFDPDARTGEQLHVNSSPPEPRRRVANVSVFQQVEELRWLNQLAAGLSRTERATANHEAAPETMPEDQLAAWLLKQARL